MTAKQTPLYEIHLQCGGRMVEFGGWSLPVQYSGIKEEHLAVRTKAGLFDVSHMGEFLVTGKESLAFLQKVVTNEVAKLKESQILYSPMCYSDGGTVDDLLVYKYSAEQYLVVVNAANIAKDWSWMAENQAGFEVMLEDRSDKTAQLALQGPLAQEVLAKLTDVPLENLAYYWFWPEIMVAGKQVLLSRTGYTGEDGFELYCAPQDAPLLWEAIMEAGKPLGLLPAGLGCRDTLRFEVCFPLYGHELTAEITPIEAGVGFFVKGDKADFNGKEVLMNQKQTGVKRKIVGLEMTGRGVARAGYSVFCGEERIGQITTGSYAPTLDKNLGLALIASDYTQTGQELFVEIRGKKVAAQVIQKPFYKREGK